MRGLDINKQSKENTKSTDNPFLEGLLVDKKADVETPVNPILEGMGGFKRGTSSGLEETDRGVNLDEYKPYLGNGLINLTSASDHTRASNQSGFEQATRTSAKLLPKIGLEFLAQAGNALDLEDYVNSDDEVGNWLNTWAQNEKARFDEALPVYRTNPGEALDIGDSAWWLESGSALVESATAFVGLGYAGGAAALKLLNSGGKALEFLNVLKKGATAADSAQKGIRVAGGLANTLMLNQAEGVGIAANVYNDLYASTVEELKLNNPNLSEEEIDSQAKQEAADGAATVVNFNRANMLLNVTSAFAFLKTPALTRGVREATSLGRSVKSALGEGLQESLEETVNLVAEKQAYKDGYSFNDARNDVFTREGAESALLGFVGGAGQTALTNAGRTLKTQRDGDGKRVSANTLQNQRYAEQQASKSRIEALTKEGKFKDNTDAYLKAEETFDLYSRIAKATEEGDTDKVKALKDTLVSVQAYDAFTNGTTEQYLNIFKGIEKLTAEEAELKGLDKDTYKEQSSKAIKRIESLEKEYNKSRSYINFNQVYDNRARNLSLKDSKVGLESTLEDERKSLISDLDELGIKEDTLTFSETGGLTFNNYNRYGEKKKATINSLQSLKDYKDTKDTIVNISKSISRNTEAYTKLVSEDTQKEIKEKLKKQEKDRKYLADLAKAKEKQNKANKKSTERAKKYKNENAENVKEADTTEDTTIDTEPVVTKEDDTPETYTESTSSNADTEIPVVGFTFAKFPPVFKEVEELGNSIMSKNTSNAEKISNLQSVIEKLSPNASTQGVGGMIAQLNRAIQYLQKDSTDTETAERDTNSKDEAAKNALLEATEDLSPTSEEDGLSKDEQLLIKQTRLVKTALNAMAEAGQDITNFDNVAKYTQNTIGQAKFVKVFDTFKALYNLAKVGQPSNLTYEDIFYDATTKRKIVENKQSIDFAKSFAELYSISDLDFSESENKILREVARNEGYSVNRNEKVTSADIKIVEGFNKLAHLDKKYKTNVQVNLTGKFNVLDFVTSKTDLDNELNNNASHVALDYDQFGTGAEIRLVVLDEVVYDDGSVAYADGRIVKNGDIIAEGNIDNAPIGIEYNGEILQGQYLHTTDWINENNIANPQDVTRQKKNLQTIREAVINSPNGVTTTIKKRGNGHFMRDVNGIYDKVSKNLPNVELAIGKDGAMHIENNKTLKTDNKEVLDGMLYAVMPVNKDVKFGVPIKRDSLKQHPTYISSIKEAIKLYLNNNANDERAVKLQENHQLDITTITGLKTYMEKILFLNPDLDGSGFMYDDFQNYVENHIREDVSVLRIVTDPSNPKIANLEFGIGANIGDTIRFINRDIINNIGVKEGLSAEERGKQRSATIEGLLAKLDKVLNNANINIKKDNFNSTFNFPIITATDVVSKDVDYNDFVKEHTTTDLYSYTLDNDKEIYTVQPNLEFDTTFAFKPEVVEEIIINDIVTESTTTEEEFNPYEDLDEEDVNFAPKTLTKEQQAEYENSSLNSLFIPNISINLQEVITNNIVSNVLKNINDDTYKEDPLTAIDVFLNNINNRIPIYERAIENAPSEKHKKAAEKGLQTAKTILEESGKLVTIVLSNLQQHHGIIKNGKVLQRIQQDLIEDEIGFDDFDTMVDEDGELKEFNDWDSDSAFTTDFKKKLGQEVKNYFSYIEDVKAFKIEGDKLVAIPKEVFKIPVTVPYDRVLNEVSALLAYNNHLENTDNVTVTTLDSMIATLEEHVESKPYLHNVIELLKNADEGMQNAFVGIMSKSYTHHRYIYKKKDGTMSVNNSDGNNLISAIQNEWLNNIKTSDLVIAENGEYNVNGKEVTRLLQDKSNLITLLKSPNADKELIQTETKRLLDDLGFKFSPKIISSLIENGIFYNAKRFSLLRLLNDAEGVFNIHLKSLNSIKDKSIADNNLFSDSVLNKFTRQIARLQPSHFSNSFKDVKGKTYWGYSPNKFLTDRFKTLKTDSNGILEKLRIQPFSSPSYWVKQLINNPKFKKHFGYFTVDGSRVEGFNSKKFDEMSPAEIEESKLALFYSQNRYDSKDYIVNLLYPTTSDKSVSYGVTALGFDWNNSVGAKGVLGKNTVEWLLENLVSPEINRILALQDNPDKWDIKNYREGGTMFNFIPSLNAIEDIWIKEGNVRVLNPAVLDQGKLRETIKDEIRSFITTLVDNKISNWDSYGFINKEEVAAWDERTGREFNVIKQTLRHAPKHSVRSEATNYIINYLVANVNMYQTFTTDPAFYWKSKHWSKVADRVQEETQSEDRIDNREEALSHYTKEDWIQEHEDLFDNMGKRLGGDIAPGKDIANSHNETFTLGIIADTESPSMMMDYYKGIAANEADVAAYNNVNHTDAQEYTTLKEHLHILNLEGKITKEKASELQYKDDHGIELDAEELSTILQPIKPVYVNNVWNKGIEHRLYVKSSSFPLFKQLTKGLELDKLRANMELNNIDRVAFESAIKIGGTIKPNSMFIDNKYTKKEIQVIGSIPREGFKIQQEVPYKEKESFINDGTQQRKLLTASVRALKAFKLRNSDTIYSGKEIQGFLDEKYNDLFKLNYKELIKELKFDINKGTIDMKKLQDVLVKEAISRDYPLYDVEALEIAGDSFTVPLWATGVSSKIEAMITSIVDNRVRKIKTKGRSYVLGSSAGFHISEGAAGKRIYNNTKGIVYDQAWLDRGDITLRSMHIEDASGKLKGEEGFDETTAKVQPAEILVPFSFFDDKGIALEVADFTDAKGNIDTTKLPDNLRELFGFRIPTQGLNSMAYIKIVGFLPKRSGDLLIAPADWTVQMGSDFDVDKLFSNSYHTTYKDGKLTRYEGDDTSKHLINDILDLHFSILGSTDSRVQAMITKPLDMGKLPQLIEEIYPHVETGTKGIGISEEYQSYKYRNARAAKAGVGVFSTDSTFLASVQDKDINLQYSIKGRVFNYSFNIAGKNNNSLSDPNTVTGNRKKSDVNAAIQSLAVDNENEQGMHKLNINTHTFDAIRTLVASGFEEDAIFYFINQPIIRKFVDLSVKANDSATTYSKEKIDTDINTLFPVSGEVLTVEESDKYNNISKEQLLNMIKGTVESNESQIVIFTMFKELSSYGKSIKSVQSAINSDSAGLGKDLHYATAKEQQLLSLRYNTRIGNASSLIGNYITVADGKGDSSDGLVIDKGVEEDIVLLIKEWYEGKLTKTRKKEIVKAIEAEGYVALKATEIEGDTKDTISFIKPTTINGFASVYGLLLNNQIWGQQGFFPYNDFGVLNAIKSVKITMENTGDSITENAETDKRIFSSIKSFITTSLASTFTDGDVQSERYRLLVNEKDKNVSIATITRDLRNANKLNNAFINRLTFDIGGNQLPSTVEYAASTSENVNESSIYSAIAQMLTDDTELGVFNGIVYSPKTVMQDLITAQMLTGGVQKSKQFIKYIPISYLKTVGYYEQLKNINFNNEEEFNREAFEIQTVQHFPKQVEVDKINLGTDYKMYNQGTVIMKSSASAKNLPNMFSIPNPKAVSGYSLYLFDKESQQWRQIDTLGKGDVKEYDAGILIGKSIIPSNQTPKQPEVTIPTTEKEVKDFLEINKNTSEDVEVIYDPKDVSISEYYNLRSKETSLGKFSFILSKIISDGDNKYNSFLAQQLHNNLDKLKEYRFILDNGLGAKGSFNLKDKTIKINLKNIPNKQDFEYTILEEVIHAYTKEALINNTHGEVARLKGIRAEAETKVREFLGEGADIKFNTVRNKIAKGIPLNSTEEQLIYPVLNDVEFVGRLFKSKQLQELLNTAPEGTKSTLSKMWDLVVSLLNSIGIDIKKGSALEYATLDIISLINSQPPSSSIKGEMNSKVKTTRTPQFVYERFALYKDDGSIRALPIDTADKIVKWVKDNTSNLEATHIQGILDIRNKPLDLFNMPPLPDGYTKTKAYKDNNEANRQKEINRENRAMEIAGLETRLEEALEEQKILMENSPYIKIANSMPKILPASAVKETGMKVGTGKDINPTLLSTAGVTVQKAAHSMMENFNIDESEARDIIIEILSIGKKAVINEASNQNEIDNIRLDLNNLQDDLDPVTEQGKATPLLKSIKNRVDFLKRNIEKAEKAEDFKKAEELKDVLEDLEERRDGVGKRENDPSIVQITRLTQIATKGEQDMQEIAEMLKRKVTLEDTLYIRKVIHFWKTAKESMFGEDELQSKVLTDAFSVIANDAVRHENDLIVHENRYMENLIKKYGNHTTVDDIFNHFKDINGLTRDFLDISRIGNPMLDSIFLTVKDANIDALDESKEILSELSSLENKIRPLLKSLGYSEPYEVFRQRNKNKKLTGHIVNRYSTVFSKAKRNHKNLLRDNNTFDNYSKLLNWAKENTKQINLQYLFPTTAQDAETKEKANKYKEELKKDLGEKEYNEFMSAQSTLLEKYENFKQGRLERLADKYNITIDAIGSNPDANTEYNNWITVNSPYIYYRHLAMEDTDSFGKIVNFKNFNSPSFVNQIPLNKDDYDNNFKIIEQHPELLEFYNYYKKVDKELKAVMPSETRTQLAFNGIPYIEKVLFEEYKDKGMKAGLAPILDGMKRSVRTNIEGTVNNKFIDPVTEVEEQKLGLDLTANTTDEYISYINTKTIEYKLETGNEPSNALISEWGEDIIDTLAQKKSYDLPKILRVYSLLVLTYKHKARIEDNIKLAQSVLGRQKELPRNSKGQIETDAQGRIIPKSAATSFLNTKKQFDYYTQVFYGKTKINEGVTNNKVYTKEEKVKLANYKELVTDLEQQLQDGKLSQKEFDNYNTLLQDQIAELGGVAVWSKRGDNILKYIQLKSMGWNLMSAIANIGFGFIANKIEASGGMVYNSQQLGKAYRMTWDSFVKNWTFNKVESPTAKKIRSMMDKYDVLKDATHELFQNPMNIEVGKNAKWLTPYNTTQRTEYLNQAPILIAMMLGTKVSTAKGEISLWDGYDIDGSWKLEYGEEPKEIVRKLRHKIDQTNKMNHGNYDGNSPLRIKNEFKGRAISQFRTWLFEGVASRFEGRKEDALLGVRKGRYRSFITYFQAVGTSKATIDTIKGILHSASFGVAFKGLNFDENVDGKTLEEIDAANMRKVMTEVVMLIGLQTSYYMLKMLGEGLDDEDDANKKFVLNTLINQGTRLKTDILFYLHPGEFKNLLRDLVPAASLVKDGFDFLDAGYRFTIGDDEIPTGVYSGHSRLLREVAQGLPLGTQVYKNINYGIQTFD